jgi:hypothetical protein
MTSNSDSDPRGTARADRRNMAICAMATLAAIVLIWPFAEGGIVDEFTFAHTAKALAETGRLTYNGWATPILGAQAWWTAIWIRLFGFSFAVCRLSLLPLVLAVPVLTYILSRRSGLLPSDSLFAGLLLGLNPQFLYIAPLFMTDASSLGMLLASLYGFARAFEAANSPLSDVRSALAWIGMAMGCALLGGTIRQSVWFAAVAGSIVLASRPSVRPTIRITAAITGLLGLATVVAGQRWFDRQPYAIPAQPADFPDGLHFLSATSARFCQFVAYTLIETLPLVMFGLPAVIALSAAGRWRGPRWRPSFAHRWRWANSMAVLAVLAVLAVATLGWQAIRGPASGAGSPPTPSDQLAFDLTVVFLRFLRGGLFVTLLLTASFQIARAPWNAISTAWFAPAGLLMLSAYAAVYAPAVVRISFMNPHIYERYYLPCIPAAAIAILLWHDGQGAPNHSPRRSRWGYALLGIAAAYGIAHSHDNFAECRARLDAIAYLSRQGIPRDRIMASWTIDGWEQVAIAGHMNDSRIRVPPDAYRPLPADGYPAIPLREALSAMTPEYLLITQAAAEAGKANTTDQFPFTAWLPPYRRTVTIRHHQPDDTQTKGQSQ